MKLKLGIIEEGKLEGKKVILEPRVGLEDNEYLVEQGVFLNGSPMFQKACLVSGCEHYIGAHCEKCHESFKN